MLAVLVFSYRQTIHAYPSGGGAYIVAKDNLGRMPSLIAAASLLIDYVLTVAVSIAAGVAAVTSAVPQWHLNRVEIALGFVALLAHRQPPRHPRVRPDLRRADLLLHRQHPGARRHRRVAFRDRLDRALRAARRTSPAASWAC